MIIFCKGYTIKIIKKKENMVFGLKILKLINKLFNKGEIPFKRCTLFSRQIFYAIFFSLQAKTERRETA